MSISTTAALNYSSGASANSRSPPVHGEGCVVPVSSAWVVAWAVGVAARTPAGSAVLIGWGINGALSGGGIVPICSEGPVEIGMGIGPGWRPRLKAAVPYGVSLFKPGP